jgi:hypothetical protein
MSRSYEFVFGTRPWRLWHMLHIAMLLPILWFVNYFQHFVPGAGPQGGEAVFALMLAYILGFGILSAVNALLLAFKAEGNLIQRVVLWPLYLVGAWSAAIGLVLIGAELGTAVESDAVERWGGVVCCVAALAVYYGANLAALRRARRG